MTIENILRRDGGAEARAATPGGQRFKQVLNEVRGVNAEARANTNKSKFEQWFTTKNLIKAIGVISALGLAAGVADAISPDVAGKIGSSVHNDILKPVWEIVKYPFKSVNLNPIRKEGIFQLRDESVVGQAGGAAGAGIIRTGVPFETPLTQGADIPALNALGATEKAKIWMNTGTGGPVYRFINDLMSKVGLADPSGVAQNVTEFAGGITTAFTGDTLGGYTDYKYSGKLLPVTALVGGVAALKAVKPIERYRDWADVKEARAGGMGFSMNLAPRQPQINALNNMESALVAPAAGPV